MVINEDYIEDIELQQDEVSVTDSECSEYPYVLRLKTAVIPKGRGLDYYFSNIIRMNKVIERALSGYPLVDGFDRDFEIKRLSGGEMGFGDEEITLDDGHRFFDDPERINKHGRSMEYFIRIDVRLNSMFQIRKFMLFMWNVLIRAIDASFKAQTSAQYVKLEDGNHESFIYLSSNIIKNWTEPKWSVRNMYVNAMEVACPHMKSVDIERQVNEFLDNAEEMTATDYMSVQNKLKKTAMSELSKIGL